jgi:ABC-type branched-subunit amino acid transport system permease subunit
MKLDRTTLTIAAVTVVLLVAGPMLPAWMMSLIKISLCYGIVVLGMMVLMRTGLVSFGHGLYFCLGAYAAAAHDKLANSLAEAGASSSWSLVRGALGLPKVLVDALTGVFGPYDIAVMLGFAVVVTGFTAWILGFLLRKYREIFFAMLSLAFSMILYGSLVKSSALGSTDGFNIAAKSLFGATLQDDALRQAIFITIIVVTMLSAWLINLYLRTHRGRLAEAIRDNELRVEYMGASVHRTIHVNYMISAVLAGLGGALMAINIGHIDPEMSYWTTSGEFVFIGILAGTGSVLAPFLGALIFETIRSFAYEYSPNTWQMALGITMLLVILFLPGGLWSLFQKMRRKAA